MTKSRAGKGVGKHRVVSHKAWIEARRKFLAKEKKFTRLRDALARQRRALPWERVDKQYVFDAPKGGETLAELFGGKSQLVVYHFMFAPDWNEGCKHCSFWADNFNGLGIHLNHRDVSFIAISRAPLAKLDAFKKRMAGASSGSPRAGTISTTTTRPRSPRRKSKAGRRSSTIRNPTSA